jgi:peptidoglycan/xylan/chitin deacetylase (PgdA/CDA1 family)
MMFTGGRVLGVNAVVRHLLRRGLLVLAYHGVVGEDQRKHALRYRNTVSVRELTLQLKLICRFFTPISAWDLLDWVAGRGELPPAPVLVTFDDGFRNNLVHAAPLLERYGVPALIHICTGYVGTERILWTQELNEIIATWPRPTFPMPMNQPDIPLPSDPDARLLEAERVRACCKQILNPEREDYLCRLRNQKLPIRDEQHRELFEFLNWDEVRTLFRRGFAIGAHTVEHSILTQLAVDTLDRELRDSKHAIEREVGAPCEWFAYPNGGPADISSPIVSRVEAAGYKSAFTLQQSTRNYAHTHPLLLDRVGVVGQEPQSLFHARISGVYSVARTFASPVRSQRRIISSLTSQRR